MRQRRRLRRIAPRGLVSFFVLIIFLFLLTQGLLMIERNMRPAVLAIAKMKADGLATEAINNAILEKVTRGIQYKDLIMI